MTTIRFQLIYPDGTVVGAFGIPGKFTGIVIDSYLDKVQLVDGLRHRDNGLPAYEGSDGYKGYWIANKRHRDKGLPALEHPDGNHEYWVNGKKTGQFIP
jgi:hypothetical protein